MALRLFDTIKVTITMAQPMTAAPDIRSRRKRNVQTGLMTGSDMVIKLAWRGEVQRIPMLKNSQAMAPDTRPQVSGISHPVKEALRTAGSRNMAGSKKRKGILPRMRDSTVSASDRPLKKYTAA